LEVDLLLSPGPADLAPQGGHQGLKIPLGGAQVSEQGPGIPRVTLDMLPERLLRILAGRDVNDRLAGPTGYGTLRRVEHPLGSLTARRKRQGRGRKDQEERCAPCSIRDNHDAIVHRLSQKNGSVTGGGIPFIMETC